MREHLILGHRKHVAVRVDVREPVQKRARPQQERGAHEAAYDRQERHFFGVRGARALQVAQELVLLEHRQRPRRTGTGRAASGP
jgi:hypothetical protein